MIYRHPHYRSVINDAVISGIATQLLDEPFQLAVIADVRAFGSRLRRSPLVELLQLALGLPLTLIALALTFSLLFTLALDLFGALLLDLLGTFVTLALKQGI